MTSAPVAACGTRTSQLAEKQRKLGNTWDALVVAKAVNKEQKKAITCPERNVSSCSAAAECLAEEPASAEGELSEVQWTLFDAVNAQQKQNE